MTTNGLRPRDSTEQFEVAHMTKVVQLMMRGPTALRSCRQVRNYEVRDELRNSLRDHQSENGSGTVSIGSQLQPSASSLHCVRYCCVCVIFRVSLLVLCVFFFFQNRAVKSNSFLTIDMVNLIPKPVSTSKRLRALG